MRVRKTLILLTNIYPYGFGESFLETELFYLSKAFKNILILPFRKSSNIRSLPKNVQVSNILTKEKKFLIVLKYFLKVLHSMDFRRELSRLTYAKRVLCFGNLFLFQCKAFYIKDLVKHYIYDNDIQYKNIVLYTYWLTSGAYGLGLLKAEQRNIKLVSRAHGYDVYDHRWFMGVIPLQLKNIRSLDKLFLISMDGYQYLANKYSGQGILNLNKMLVSKLGVKKAHLAAEQHNPCRIFRVLTCSNFGRIKRIDLLINALAILDSKEFDKKIEWTHIGGCKKFWKLNQRNYREIASKKLRRNVTLKFYGVVPHDDVLKIIQNSWFDLFVNVSDSEGIPVSIMEAQSCGIPVIARNVGGISEIVNSKNGMLLDEVISPRCLADALSKIMSAEEEWRGKRRQAFETWDREFNADKNYKVFVDALSNT